MATFQYSALDAKGEQSTGALSANSEAEAIQQLRAKGLYPTQINEEGKTKGKGKSGGSRVITCVKVIEQDVYLLSIFDKSDKDSISDKELDNLLRLAGLL
jgi:type II secretory pathway component PulF